MELLDALDTTAFSWSSVIVAVLLGLISYFGDLAIKNLKKGISDAQLRISSLEEKASNSARALEIAKLNTIEEMRKMDDRINATHLIVLDKLDELKTTFYEYRK